MSDKPAAAAAVLADVEKGKELKKVSAPGENLASVRDKVLVGVTGKHNLSHVDAPAGAGLTEAQKAAYLEDKKEKESAK